MRCQIGRVRAREKNESAETDGGRVGPLGGWEDLLVSGGRTAIARSDSLCLLYDPCAPAGRTGRTGLSLRERARLPKDDRGGRIRGVGVRTWPPVWDQPPAAGETVCGRS